MELSSVYRCEFFEGVRYGGDGHEVVQRCDGGGLEAAAHLADNGILGDLEGFNDAFVASLGGIEREPIS